MTGVIEDMRFNRVVIVDHRPSFANRGRQRHEVVLDPRLGVQGIARIEIQDDGLTLKVFLS